MIRFTSDLNNEGVYSVTLSLWVQLGHQYNIICGFSHWNYRKRWYFLQTNRRHVSVLIKYFITTISFYITFIIFINSVLKAHDPYFSQCMAESRSRKIEKCFCPVRAQDCGFGGRGFEFRQGLESNAVFAFLILAPVLVRNTGSSHHAWWILYYDRCKINRSLI